MITLYAKKNNQLEAKELTNGNLFDNNLVWIDLLKPSLEERTAIENLAGCALPSAIEAQEIEPSNRLYVEKNNCYMTMSATAIKDDNVLESGNITFVLTDKYLISLRSVDNKSFPMMNKWQDKFLTKDIKPEGILVGVLEGIVAITADRLENTEDKLAKLSYSTFSKASNSKTIQQQGGLRGILQEIGNTGDLLVRTRNSLEGCEKIIEFLCVENINKLDADDVKRLKISTHDIRSLIRHSDFLEQQVTFSLDAAVGMITIAQNDVFNWFSVIATIFMPPTLIASIYGMNFKFIPELSWHGGYLFAIFFMIFAAVVPLWVIRRKGWF